MVSPGTFIPIAERFGLIEALGDWVPQEACRQIARRRQGMTLRVAVNVSVHQLRRGDFADRVVQAIDRSFVCDLESGTDARAIVRAIVDLAHALHLDVVAEGVETVAQRDVLTAMDCDELQGDFHAKPMPAEATRQWTLDLAWRGAVGVP